MFDSFGYDVENIALRLCDDAYVAWLHAEADSGQALGAWSDGKASIRAAAYLSYRAALDREEAAARDLERLWALARRCRRGREMVRDGVELSRCSGDPWFYTSRDGVGGWSWRKVEPWSVP